jgi:hypothetical protein
VPVLAGRGVLDHRSAWSPPSTPGRGLSRRREHGWHVLYPVLLKPVGEPPPEKSELSIETDESWLHYMTSILVQGRSDFEALAPSALASKLRTSYDGARPGKTSRLTSAECLVLRDALLAATAEDITNLWGAKTRSCVGSGRFGALRARSVAGSVDDGRSSVLASFLYVMFGRVMALVCCCAFAPRISRSLRSSCFATSSLCCAGRYRARRCGPQIVLSWPRRAGCSPGRGGARSL